MLILYIVLNDINYEGKKMKKYVSEEGWTEVTCDCGSLMKEFTAFRSVSVFCCFDCFDLSTKTGKFFADIE